MIKNATWSRSGVLCIIVALMGLQLGSRADAGGSISITSVPAWGQSGSVKGNVSGVDASTVHFFLFAFAPDFGGWFSTCSPIQIQGTGDFAVDLSSSILNNYATRFSAYLVPAALPIPCAQGVEAIPFVVERNALARATIPRLPRLKTISFSGMTWYVRNFPLKTYPGPQFFIDDNAFVDGSGRLHLKLTRCQDSWCAAEVFTTDTVGYGTYSFQIDSPLNTLDPNVTLGLFTWDELASDQFHREWDIEFSRWGQPNASFSAQYVVQPYNGPNNMVRFLMSPATVTSHVVTWLPSQVGFSSVAGSLTAPGATINQWTYSGGQTPPPQVGDARLHLNLYVNNGQAPLVPANTEIIINRIQYTPTPSQIAFSKTSDSVSFLSTVSSVAVNGTPGCSATVESDSTWLNVVGPNPVAAGGLIQYSVLDNLQGSRFGNLILHSTSCNLTVGKEVLAVAQSGLVCDASFDQSSSQIGFFDSMRSLLIRATAPSCSWSVTSSMPWLKLTSPSASSGTGQIQFYVDANAGQDLRHGALQLNNGKQHDVYQDASSAMMAISPVNAVACPSQDPRFSVTWVSSADAVELRLNTPDGQALGQFSSSGYFDLPKLPDGAMIYLVQPSASRVLASVRVSMHSAGCNDPSIAARGVVNAASFSSISFAPNSLVTVFGTALSSSAAQARSLPLPTSLGGVTVNLSGTLCPILFVSPTQVNFLIPSDTRPGRYVLTIGQASTELLITSVAPGIFTVSGTGSGTPAMAVLAVRADGTTINIPTLMCSNGSCNAVPLAIPEDAQQVYFVLYGTGIRNAKSISATLGPMTPEVLYFGESPQFAGVDQINLRIANTTRLNGLQSLTIKTESAVSNKVDLLFP